MINVVFCIPGKTFSQYFLKSWCDLFSSLPSYKVIPTLHCAMSSNVYYARDLCLLEDMTKGVNQKPFQGKIEYDYIMWIDGDSIFTPGQFKSLLDRMEENRNIHILSGLYLKYGGKEYTTVVNLDEDYIEKFGEPRFLSVEELKGEKELMDVAYTGFGFMMVRYGVFEKLSYPWFQPVLLKKGEIVRGFASEDASFCLRAKEKGFNIWIDPNVIVGHEKIEV